MEQLILEVRASNDAATQLYLSGFLKSAEGSAIIPMALQEDALVMALRFT